MMCSCSTANSLSQPHPIFWAVKSYLDLIGKPDRLTYGSGLKRLYALSHGASTLNERDIIDITDKSVKLGLIPRSIDSFLTMSILKNCHLYGTILSEMITSRIVGISNGDISNPIGKVRNDDQRARRAFYIPPIPFIKRLQISLREDIGSVYTDSELPSVTMRALSDECLIILGQYQRNEGVITDQEATYGSIVASVERLVAILYNEATYANEYSDYKSRSKYALNILLVITKLLHGDLTDRPSALFRSRVDLENKLNMSDGTLAAIPFPIKQSLNIFEDSDQPSGITMKGRTYLAAVSSALFHRCETLEER